MRDIFSCDVRRPKVDHHEDYRLQRCASVHHVLDQLPHCETCLIIVTPPEVIADELETQRKRNEVENVRGVREHSRVVSETGSRGTCRFNDGQFFPMAPAPNMFTMLKRAMPPVSTGSSSNAAA